ncbi:MAG: cyclase family protein [Opitutaceae bacterium]|nr:cyclase family protein [Opitutaceae bacterium]
MTDDRFPDAQTRFIDLTLPLVSGARGVAVEPKFTLERDGWNAATWHLYSHAGTHMDAPAHFGAGPQTIDQQPVDRCIGPAWVVRLAPCAPRALLTVAHLGATAEKFRRGENLLLHTGWSEHANDSALYRDALPRISSELAEWCVARGVNMLGVEPPSVADVNNRDEVTRIHKILLGGGVTIVEGLAHLDRLAQERVLFAALPLRLAGGDGSPVRAFAIEGWPTGFPHDGNPPA